MKLYVGRKNQIVGIRKYALWTECLCSPKLHMLKPYPQSDGIRRQGLWEVIRIRWSHEGGAPMNEISAHIGESLLPLCSPLCEDTLRSQQSETQKEVLTRTQPCWHSDLRLLASRTVRNKCLLFISLPSYGVNTLL